MTTLVNPVSGALEQIADDKVAMALQAGYKHPETATDAGKAILRSKNGQELTRDEAKAALKYVEEKAPSSEFILNAGKLQDREAFTAKVDDGEVFTAVAQTSADGMAAVFGANRRNPRPNQIKERACVKVSIPELLGKDGQPVKIAITLREEAQATLPERFEVTFNKMSGAQYTAQVSE